jgi:TatD DNase family protein
VPFELIDTHAHLDAEQFQDDLPAVLARAAAARVRRIVTVGTTLASSLKGTLLTKREESLFSTVGIHPNNAAGAAESDWCQVASLATRPRVVGIGETGLDRHWNDTPFPLQEDYFARHLDLARRVKLPVIIHCREAEADVLRMLRDDFDRNGPIKGVMHSFAADAATAAACLAMGLHISFAGMLTYKNAQALRDIAKTIPADRLLVETDSPYLAPVPVRGKRNEPANVVHTAACLADVRGVGLEELARITTGNARSLFAIAD